MSHHPCLSLFPWRVFLSLCIVALCLTVARAQAQSPAAEALKKQAPEILEFLAKHGYRNVGVLKFRIWKKPDAPSDDVGTLNRLFADRLEAALVLANHEERALSLGIIKQASDVAAETVGASHHSPRGRETLLTSKYPLRWASPPVTADAFLTGMLVVPEDLQELIVSIQVFGKKHAELKQIGGFRIPLDGATLAELGENFRIRGGFDGGKVEKSAAISAALAARKQTPGEQLVGEKSEIDFQILYDGIPTKIEFREGGAFVREPQEKEAVTFLVKYNARDSKTRLGAVLKVNGESTWFRQRERSLDCSKWVLGPGSQQISIAGIQVDNSNEERFKVLSRAESRRNEVHYGADVGLITLEVFREAEPIKEGAEATIDPDVAAIDEAALPKVTPKTPVAAKLLITEGTNRGLIGTGQRLGQEVERVPFRADPTPIYSLSVRYYRP